MPRRLLVVMALLLGLGAAPVTSGVQAPRAAAGTSFLTADEQVGLNLVNDYRSRRGLPAITADPRAEADARDWARHLGQQGQVFHDAGLRSDCDAGGPCSGWAENVGMASTQEEVVRLFAASSGHAANMSKTSSAAGDTYRIGIGVYRRGGAVYVVQRFYACPCYDQALSDRLQSALGATRRFASTLRTDFLGRAGSGAEIDAVAAPVLYGDARDEVVTAVATSDEWLGALVDGYYRATLGRTADADGKAYWIGRLRSGETPAEVAAAFYACDEYYARTGSSAGSWIEDLYRKLIARTPSNQEERYWVHELDLGRSRGAVANAIYQSVESRRRRVTQLYRSLLGREPDKSGLDHWTEQLADGHDVRLAVHLASSDEYYARATG